jgi:hypothetical protein
LAGADPSKDADFDVLKDADDNKVGISITYNGDNKKKDCSG